MVAINFYLCSEQAAKIVACEIPLREVWFLERSKCQRDKASANGEALHSKA